VQVPVIDKISFLKAIKMSRTYYILTFSQKTVHNVNVCHVEELSLEYG
jgi:hypothetical protein